ncbi:zinc ribbon-containing protein [Candidatus Venteria ishoeyi]|uniref:Uncharacterized protein n=1 Tax=Candidatus Venteria ishoeyi TaxID=1899563 RepID=A0A1H6FD92_9GAMM|nr:zinc ribbon-containing protein [Candidatus Venteria ishoeyi]MDM8545398.1 zinc ribbon-containing protein [Candidatus Venteria ishoeyi]SEH07289.1 Uncharacterised protein [Candidatus Venteria ishoeyi]
MSKQEQDQSEKLEAQLEQSYNTLMQRVKESLNQTREGVGNLRQYIDTAVNKAIELEEINDMEARKLGNYLHRDVQDAAKFLVETGKELKDWMRFDLSLIEGRILDSFSGMVDYTRIELDKIAEQAQADTHIHTGEIASPGTIACNACGKEMTFHKPGRIPPCPACHKTEFSRVWNEPDAKNNAE